MQDLKEWRQARATALSRNQRFKTCSPTSRRLARHMIRSRDARDGAGIYRSPRKLARELRLSESTVRRSLAELVAGEVFRKERRKDPRGTGRRDTTSAYHLRDELLPAPLRCVTVTDLRPDPDPLRCVTSDTPGDTPVDTPRRRTDVRQVEDPPLGGQKEEDVEGELLSPPLEGSETQLGEHPAELSTHDETEPSPEYTQRSKLAPEGISW